MACGGGGWVTSIVKLFLSIHGSDEVVVSCHE